jgi:hypothetical protein
MPRLPRRHSTAYVPRDYRGKGQGISIQNSTRLRLRCKCSLSRASAVCALELNQTIESLGESYG